jgi:serine/threonine protein kinase
VWSVGCVIAELMLTMPIFPGESGVDQIVEIIKILGTPTKDDIQAMNPNYTEYRFPSINPIPWEKVFKPNTNAASIKFISRLLVYKPKQRPNPLFALLDPYFDDLRDENCTFPDGSKIDPEIFKFTDLE